MKKKSFVFSLASSLLALTCLSGCSSQEEGIVLKVLNCEDYIGEDEFDSSTKTATNMPMTTF